MVDLGSVPGDHNDADAKQTVASLLQEMGWRPEQILDLGDITA